MTELTSAQEKALEIIQRIEYRWRGCPSRLVNGRTLKALLNKGLVKKGVRKLGKIFINWDVLRKLK